MKLRGPPAVGTMDRPGVTGRCPRHQAAVDIESLRMGLPQWFPVTETPLTEPTASEPSETEVPPPSRRRLPKLPLPPVLARPPAGRAAVPRLCRRCCDTHPTSIPPRPGSSAATVPPRARSLRGGCTRRLIAERTPKAAGRRGRPDYLVPEPWGHRETEYIYVARDRAPER